MSNEPSTSGVFARQPAPLQDREGRLDPFDWYQKMRDERPVSYDEERRAWDVFKYDAVRTVLSDYETFSSDTPPDDDSGADDSSPLSASMISVDPPEHERLRQFVDDRFQPDAIRDRRPYIETVAESLLDDIEGETFDIVSAYSFPLPVIVIAELLDIPAERRDEFKQWSDALVAAPREQTEETLRKNEQHRTQSIAEMSSFFRNALTERRGSDRDDLVTLAANAEALSPTEQLGFCILLLIAGNITTTNLITNAIWSFAEQDILHAVASGAVDRKQAIEEALRFRSPVQAMSRVATEDTEIDGVEIAADERVTAWIGSANRDESVFDNPDEFLPERSPNRHIAFGTGVHYCLGAPLARLEAGVALSTLFDRYDTIELRDDQFQPVSSPIVYGLESLPLHVE
ncbi:cytochrome P450 [Halocatena pleomorpha]|uniref:Cytochrome P450 n=1 Tax=Halocatena pleomorpha TaxID=1785090 RepID=A0A3P3RF90_9EURY|nr:cytochrome P450 [Halocatena pleomorpha]RRJ31420.1 cytochrome P450 [Halocatena pleomorpha]